MPFLSEWGKRSVFLLLVFLFFTFPASASNSANDFEIKAFHVDLRSQVMTMEALTGLVDKLSEIGVNTLIMEWEATFPFDKHATLCNKYVYTKDTLRYGKIEKQKRV